MSDLEFAALVSWDTETELIQPGLLSPPIVCHSFASALFPVGLLKDKASGLAIIKANLQLGHTVSGANIAYDFGCLLAEDPSLLPLVWKAYEEGRVHDVLIAATLVAISQGRLRDGELFDVKGQKMRDDKGRITPRYSLFNTTKEWLGREDAKGNDRFRMSYALLKNTPIEQWPTDAQQYPKDDAVNTLEVAEAQLASGFDFKDLKVQCHAAFCAHIAAMFGLRTDAERVNKLEGELLEKESELHGWAHKLGLLRKNEDGSFSKNTKLIGEVVSRAYLGNPPLTPGGGVSLAREALEESGDETLEKFSELGKVQKNKTYLPTLRQAAAGPLNVKPNILLSTGRASYEGMLQLLPRKGGIRECFKARGTYVSVDYAAVEMATLAQVCLWTVGESKLAAAINAGQDPHCIISADMTGVTYDEFYRAYKAGDPVLKDIRQAGKAGDFGYPGMMGAPRFTIAQRKAGHSVCEWFHRDGNCGHEKTLEWKGRKWDGGALCVRCIEESARIKKSFTSTWDEVPKYWRWITGKLEFNDVLEQFVSGRLRGGLSAPAAANTLFQGLAADGAKRAVVALTREMYLDTKSPLYGSRLCVFAHDETIIDVPAHMDLHNAACRQRDIMVEEMSKVCPDVKISAEPAAMKYWTKAAEPVFSSAGRLIPWEEREKDA